MVIYKRTQMNISRTLKRCRFLTSFPERATFAAVLERVCVQAGSPFVLDEKYYGHDFIIKRFTGGLIADHNVLWNNNFFSVA